jgi:hypothetical protein
MTAPSLFLAPADVATLTGRKRPRSQIEALRNMGVQFYQNALGHPVVPVTAITGSKTVATEAAKWQPAVVNQG